MPPDFRLAVLASGRGSNLEALLDAGRLGRLAAVVAGVFSDKPGCPAMALATAAGVPATALTPAGFESREAFDEALFGEVEAIQPDLIVCAGYMRVISQRVVERFTARMINIHPSLLPAHPGLRTHARALAAGDRVHGASVHQVVPVVDSGPILSQVRIDVCPGETADSLGERVLAREHPLLVATVNAISEGKLSASPMGWRWNGTALRQPLSLNADNELEQVR